MGHKPGLGLILDVPSVLWDVGSGFLASAKRLGEAAQVRV